MYRGNKEEAHFKEFLLLSFLALIAGTIIIYHEYNQSINGSWFLFDSIYGFTFYALSLIIAIPTIKNTILYLKKTRSVKFIIPIVIYSLAPISITYIHYYESNRNKNI